MPTLNDLLENNKEWSESVSKDNQDFFENSAKGQAPDVLWIGCADSRVPASKVVGTNPGEMFVHRNIANMVVHTDLNLLSVLQYAVDVLKVKHVVVCGHYGCGGVKASLMNDKNGIIDNWLLEIKDLANSNSQELNAIADIDERVDRLVELNVAKQVRNVAHTTIVQECWSRGQELSIHGWVYGLKDGLITDLELDVTNKGQLAEIYQYNV